MLIGFAVGISRLTKSVFVSIWENISSIKTKISTDGASNTTISISVTPKNIITTINFLIRNIASSFHSVILSFADLVRPTVISSIFNRKLSALKWRKWKDSILLPLSCRYGLGPVFKLISPNSNIKIDKILNNLYF